MAKCVFEHCNAEGGRIQINFTTEDDEKRYANVSMCLDCHATLRANKKGGIENSCTVSWREPYKHWLEVDFSYLDGKKMAEVVSLSLHR